MLVMLQKKKTLNIPDADIIAHHILFWFTKTVKNELFGIKDL